MYQVLGTLAGTLISSLLRDEGPSGAPVPEPVKTMPLPDDEAARKAKRRSIAGMRARSGRASTILTDAGDLTSDALGGS